MAQQASPAVPRRFLTVDEVARLCGVSQSSIYRALAAGELRSTRLRDHGRLLIPVSELHRLEGKTA